MRFSHKRMHRFAYINAHVEALKAPYALKEGLALCRDGEKPTHMVVETRHVEVLQFFQHRTQCLSWARSHGLGRKAACLFFRTAQNSSIGFSCGL